MELTLDLGLAVVFLFPAHDRSAGDCDDTRALRDHAVPGCVLKLLGHITMHHDIVPSGASTVIVDGQREPTDECVAIPSKPGVTAKSALQLELFLLRTFTGGGDVSRSALADCRRR